jgi:DNA-binding response OmpR family regulator
MAGPEPRRGGLSSELERLRRQNAEMADELAEWRRQYDAGALDAARASLAHDMDARFRSPIYFTPGEWRILVMLIERSPRTVARQGLLGADGGERSSDVVVCRLRAKLRPVFQDGAIETVRGSGWRVREDCARALRATLKLSDA